MAYSNESTLIDVTVLCDLYDREQEGVTVETGKERVTRWLKILTREHIEEKIKEAIKSGKRRVSLVDEEVEPKLARHIHLSRLVREIWPPHTTSVFEHIQSLLDTKTATISYSMERTHISILVDWSSPIDLLKEDPCPGYCSFCLCLCCISWILCHH